MTSFSRIWQAPSAGREFTVDSVEMPPETFRPLWRPAVSASGLAAEVSGAAESGGEQGTATLTVHTPTECAVGSMPETQAPAESGSLKLAGAEETAAVSTSASADEHSPDVVLSSDIESKLAQARNEGMELGREEGRAQARAELAARQSELSALLASLANECESPAIFFDPLKRLAVYIAEKIVRSELESRAEVIENIVTGCISGAGEAAVIRLRLNSADAGLLREIGSAVVERFEITEDENLSRGSAVVEIADGWIEDLIDDRWKTVCAGLLARP